MKVRHQILSNFIIRTISKFFDDKCTDNYTYRRVRSKCFVAPFYTIASKFCLKHV